MFALRLKRRFGRQLPFLLLCAASSVGAQASFDLPPITMPATGDHHPGQVIWHDLETTDLPRTETFYKALFGWDMREYRTAGRLYVVAMNAGRPVAGMLRRAVHEDEEKPSVWLPFLSVRDVDAAVSLARQHAALVLADPEDRPQRGRQALIRDPDGLAIAVENSSSGDPGDGRASVGDWAWSVLFARDPAAAAVFFQQAFGYTIQGLPASSGFERILLSSGDRARLSIAPLPDVAWPPVGACVGFVRVADVADAVARALTLGGRVIVESRPDARGTVTAILADPAGALFGVLQSPPT